MGKLIAVIGNGGCGKTTLTRVICRQPGFTPYLEQHAERPFQAAFQKDLKALSFQNQVDYLLYRAEQERTIRSLDETGVQDGGLDQDFHIFTHLFLQNNYLTIGEFDLCDRLYGMLRSLLPPPDGMIRLNVPLDVLIARRNARSREIDIAGNADLPKIEALLEDWLGAARPICPILEIDASADDPAFSKSIGRVLKFISAL